MSATAMFDRARYRANPTVLQAPKSPRTREVLAGLVVGLALKTWSEAVIVAQPVWLTTAHPY